MLDKERRIKVIALAVFAVSALVQLYPLPLHPARGLNDTQDCLLNTWILAFGHHQLLSDPLHYFQANVFFPNPNSLSYSEHLFPLVVLSLPVHLLFHNPVLSYNFVFFLCCLLNAYCMFLLVRHLTRRAEAGIIAGLIFAYSATLMQQVSHLQLLAAWFIPLALLYLHKFFENGRWREAVIFAVCFTLQALSCIYYGLFFISVLALGLPLMLCLQAKKVNLRFLLRLFVPLVGAGLVLALFSLPYLWLFRFFRFERVLSGGAALLNYFAVPAPNLLLGRLLHRLGSNEYYLFPGVAALCLSVFYFIKQKRHMWSLPKVLRLILVGVIVLNACVLLLILITGGTALRIGPLSFSANNPAKPAFYLFLALCLWAIAAAVTYLVRHWRKAPAGQANIVFYFLLLVWSLFLSFGNGFTFLGNSPFNIKLRAVSFSPFHWFYNLVPGFKGIRVPARYSVFVILCLAVFAAFGLNEVLSRLRGRKAATLALAALALFINIESLTAPQKLALVPVGQDIPPTYRWLKDQPGPMAVMELPPFPGVADDALPMYFSLFHGKTVVNGYSGFIPPSSDYIRSFFQDFPSWGSIDILQELKVKYIILHTKVWSQARTDYAQLWLRKRFQTALRPVRTFRYEFQKPTGLDRFLGEDLVFEVLPALDRPDEKKATTELPPDRWTVAAEVNDNLTPLLKDGRTDTTWTTRRPQKKGDFLNIILDEALPVDRIEIQMGDRAFFGALNIQINTSKNGRQWRIGEPGYSPGAYVRDLVTTPRNSVQTIRLSGQTVRYLKLIQKSGRGKYEWCVPELKVFVVKQ